MSPLVRRDLLLVACAVSAGVHAGLAPEHLDESAATGGGFVVATALLAGSALALRLRPESRAVLTATGLTLAGLIAAYVLATTSGLPLLHPEPERVDALGLATKAVEGVGLAVAASLVRRPRVEGVGGLAPLRGRS